MPLGRSPFPGDDEDEIFDAIYEHPLYYRLYYRSSRFLGGRAQFPLKSYCESDNIGVSDRASCSRQQPFGTDKIAEWTTLRDFGSFLRVRPPELVVNSMVIVGTLG